MSCQAITTCSSCLRDSLRSRSRRLLSRRMMWVRDTRDGTRRAKCEWRWESSCLCNFLSFFSNLTSLFSLVFILNSIFLMCMLLLLFYFLSVSAESSQTILSCRWPWLTCSWHSVQWHSMPRMSCRANGSLVDSCATCGTVSMCTSRQPASFISAASRWIGKRERVDEKVWV